MRPSLIAFACSLVVTERLRQINEKGYSPDHDDTHGDEALATAAAIYLLPANLNPDIAYVETDYKMVCEPLQTMLEGSTFTCARADWHLLDAPSKAHLDARIETLTTGLALGMAELERILRQRYAVADLLALSDRDGLLATRLRQMADGLDVGAKPEGR